MLFEAVFYLKIIFPHKSGMVPEFVTTEGAKWAGVLRQQLVYFIKHPRRRRKNAPALISAFKFSLSLSVFPPDWLPWE